MLIDLIFFVLIIFACIKGSRKGFIIALFSVVAFIVGLAAALKLSAVVASKLSENVNISGKWLPVIAFILVFLVVALLVNLGGRLIQKSFEIAMLGWLNRIAGILLYILIYTIIYSIFLFYGIQLHIIKEEAILSSKMYPYIQPIGPIVINKIGSIIPIFKDLFTQLEQFFGLVSNKIAH
jgi:membrane protein required for colicin V production